MEDKDRLSGAVEGGSRDPGDREGEECFAGGDDIISRGGDEEGVRAWFTERPEISYRETKTIMTESGVMLRMISGLLETPSLNALSFTPVPNDFEHLQYREGREVKEEEEKHK